MIAGDPESWWLVASNAGYGFFVQPQDVFSRAKAGKAMLRVPDGGRALAPVTVAGDEFPEDTLVVAAGSGGHLLVFPSAELPEMARGKGVKLLGIPTKKFKNGDEEMVAMALLQPEQNLIVHCGSRHMTLKAADIAERYLGERGRRGTLLPRNYRSVDWLEPEPEEPAAAD